jgi:hypothetical protein
VDDGAARVLGQLALGDERRQPDGLTISPRSSMTKQRSASPSKASQMSAPRSPHPPPAGSAVLAGSIGFASWLGKLPSSSKYSSVVSSGSPRRPPGRCSAHAVAGVDDDLQRADALAPGRAPLMYAALAGQQVLLAGRARLAVEGRQALVEVALASARSWASRCPGRRAGRPDRHSLMPL